MIFHVVRLLTHAGWILFFETFFLVNTSFCVLNSQ